MYNENERGFSLRDIILQLLMLVLFIFILIWLFPTKGFVNDLTEKLENMSTGSDHSILYDKIFNENLVDMKEAAKSYYTTSRLPKNIGDKVSMTLGEMLDKKIILPFADKNGDACSTSDSYVEVTKMDDEFQMKVQLSCNGQEDYMIIHLGCYQYCEGDICEKEEATTVVSGSKGGSTTTSVTTKPSETVVTRPVTNNYITNNNITNNNITNNTTTNNNTTVTKPEVEPEPEPSPEPEPEKTLYYQYRTKELVSKEVNVSMCDVREYRTVTNPYYSLAHTVTSINDIILYPFAVKLPTNATNVRLKSYSLGYDNFDFNTYISQKKAGDIYNYKYNDGSTSAHTTLSDALLTRTSIRSNHGNLVVASDKVVHEKDRIEFQINYSVYFKEDVIKNAGLLHVIDATAGRIHYVPVKFVVSYDLLGSTESKKCSEVTSSEEDYVYRRWNKTETEKYYEYGSYMWTTNPNLSGVEYTGKKEYR